MTSRGYASIGLVFLAFIGVGGCATTGTSGETTENAPAPGIGAEAVSEPIELSGFVRVENPRSDTVSLIKAADGVVNQVISPDGRRVLIHIDRATSYAIGHGDGKPDPDAPGLIYVLDRKTRTVVELPSYFRAASVIWSPDGNHLAFNDKSYSSENYCYVYAFRVVHGKLTYQDTDVSELFKKLPEAAPLIELIHQYVVGVKWVDAHTLELDIEGHPTEDGKGIEWTYRYDLKGKFTKVK